MSLGAPIQTIIEDTPYPAFNLPHPVPTLQPGHPLRLQEHFVLPGLDDLQLPPITHILSKLCTRALQQGQLCRQETYAVSQASTLGLMLCCHHLDILDHLISDLMFGN